MAKHVSAGQLANQIQDNALHRRSVPQQNGRFSASDLPAKHPMWELWQRMNEMYGHRWASAQGTEPNDTWCKGCADIGVSELAVGLRGCLDLAGGWPPTLPEFRELCFAKRRRWEQQCHKIQERAALEDLGAKERRIAEGKAAIAKLRAEVGF